MSDEPNSDSLALQVRVPPEQILPKPLKIGNDCSYMYLFSTED